MTTKRPYLLGLTGSIGMGKSTTASMFAEADCAVWDADAAVHRLYATGGAAVARIAEICPEAVSTNGVDRDVLKAWIAKDISALAQLEAVVHPLVAEDRAGFVAGSKADIVVCDIPLLFETSQGAAFDSVAVVSTDAATQKARVMARPGMTEAHFQTILAKQMPDAEKRARADHVIDTSTLEGAREAVQTLVKAIRGN